MNAPFLSVVIPAYNEKARLQATLDQIFSFLHSLDQSFEVIVVDDGSRDGTQAVAQAFARTLPEGQCLKILRHDINRGKGYSVKSGMLVAQGQWALLTDADLSTPIEEYPRLAAVLKQNGLSLVLGSRALKGAQITARQTRFREEGGKMFNRVVRLLTGLPFADTQCGFKLFDLASTRPIFSQLKIERFAFDVEILYIAHKWKLKMQEIPVVWRHAQGSKVHFFPDVPRAALDLLRIRWNDLRGCYRK